MTLQHSINSIWFIWQRDEVGYGRRFVGTVEAIDAYTAARLARQQFGPGRYQVRSNKHSGIVLAHA